MKIIVVSTSAKLLIRFKLHLMLEFKKNNFEVIAVGNDLDDKWSKEFDKYSIKYIYLPLAKNGLNPFKDIAYYKQLRNLFEQEKPDIVFSYFAKPIVYGNIAAKKAKVNNIYSMICGLGSVCIGKGLKMSIIRAVLFHQYRKALKVTKKIFFQNNDDLQYMVGKKLIKSKENCVVVNGSGVDLNEYTYMELPLTPTFLFVGRLIKDKGILEFLSASEQLKKEYENIKIIVVGPVDTNPTAISSEHLKYYVKNKIIDYYGELEDVKPAIKESAVLVLPSYREGTPRSVLEAMAMGRIILTTNAPGCKETVRNGYNGFLVEPKNITQLYEKMKDIVINYENYKFMGMNSRKYAEEKFSVEEVDKKIINNILER